MHTHDRGRRGSVEKVATTQPNVAGRPVVTVRDRVRGALVETLVALVMLAGGVTLRSQTNGFAALLGLLLMLMAVMALAHAVLLAAGRIPQPDGRPQPRRRERD